MSRLRLSKLAVVVLFGVLLLGAWAYEALAAKTPQEIMRANCASCHGELGEGGYPSWIDPSQDSMRIAGRSTRSIKQWTRNGRIPEMPAFPAQEISDAELNALATYINGLPGSFIPNPTYQYTVNITDEDPWYNPMQISINVGDTVKYTNSGKTYHPVTQLEFVASKGLQGTDSGLLGPALYGGGIYFRTFNTAGQHVFLCKIHPYMRGDVYVGQGFTPPPYAVSTPKPRPAVPGGAGSEIWVLAQFQDYAGKVKDGVIQVIDASTWTVTNMIPVGNNPHSIWFTKGSTEAVVTNWFDNFITRINASTKQPITDIIGGASNAHVISNYDGSIMNVSIQGSHYIQPFKTSRWSRNAPIWTSGYGPHGIWYGGGKLITANTQDHTASFYNAGGPELATLPADVLPLGASINTTGSKGWVGNFLSADVSIYNVTNLTKIMDLSVGGYPVQPIVSPDDRYVVVANSPYTTVVDAATNTVVAQFTTGKGTHGVGYGPKSGGGLYAYITHKWDNHISVIDLTTTPPTHVGDVPLNTTTTGKTAIFGLTDTGGNGIAVRPLPAPWQ